MAKIDNVATYIIKYFDEPISTMKLHKLLYFCQGWSLALRDQPMFDHDFHAWPHGPVVPYIQHQHVSYRLVSAWTGNADELSELDTTIIDGVLEKYAALSGSDLSDLTRAPDTPWAHIAEKFAVIPKSSIAVYFLQHLTIV